MEDINQNPTQFNQAQAQSGGAVTTTVVTGGSPVPSVAGTTTVDWGSWAEQLLKNETPVIEAAAQGGVTLALGSVPFGGIVSSFIGPVVVKQYVDQALAVLEGVLANQKATINSNSTLETYVINMIQNEAPFLSAFLGSALPNLIQAALKDAGL